MYATYKRGILESKIELFMIFSHNIKLGDITGTNDYLIRLKSSKIGNFILAS